MKIGNNGNLVLGPFDESTPCLMIVLMNCQTKLRINHLTAFKSVAILESNANLNFYTWKKTLFIIVTAKVFMQKLWLLGLSWDAVVPDKEKSEFENFIHNLQDIEHLNIPRCIIQKNNTLVEIRAFSDSSEQAYGACVYVRCKDCFGNFSVHVLCSNSRVAPVKCVTLPRLEFLEAVLLSKFLHKVLEAMQMTIDAVPLYTDSTIVLSWMRTQPYRLKCFVANRVIQITDLPSIFEWHHINSKDNAADPLSRGLSVCR
ncbi:uncharacterized protein TNCV_2042261 [Trichonephila clavipes]|nr:uncharacterized protein TNCV_2042261 [Trichonephila clavipes]